MLRDLSRIRALRIHITTLMLLGTWSKTRSILIQPRLANMHTQLVNKNNPCRDKDLILVYLLQSHKMQHHKKSRRNQLSSTIQTKGKTSQTHWLESTTKYACRKSSSINQGRRGNERNGALQQIPLMKSLERLLVGGLMICRQIDPHWENLYLNQMLVKESVG